MAGDLNFSIKVNDIWAVIRDLIDLGYFIKLFLK